MTHLGVPPSLIFYNKYLSPQGDLRLSISSILTTGVYKSIIINMSITDPKDMQKAQSPRPVGSGQSPQIKQVEGSLLGKPTVAGETTGRTPQVGK